MGIWDSTRQEIDWQNYMTVHMCFVIGSHLTGILGENRSFLFILVSCLLCFCFAVLSKSVVYHKMGKNRIEYRCRPYKLDIWATQTTECWVCSSLGTAGPWTHIAVSDEWHWRRIFSSLNILSQVLGSDPQRVFFLTFSSIGYWGYRLSGLYLEQSSYWGPKTWSAQCHVSPDHRRSHVVV